MSARRQTPLIDRVGMVVWVSWLAIVLVCAGLIQLGVLPESWQVPLALVFFGFLLLLEPVLRLIWWASRRIRGR